MSSKREEQCPDQETGYLPLTTTTNEQKMISKNSSILNKLATLSMDEKKAWQVHNTCKDILSSLSAFDYAPSNDALDSLELILNQDAENHMKQLNTVRKMVHTLNSVSLENVNKEGAEILKQLSDFWMKRPVNLRLLMSISMFGVYTDAPLGSIELYEHEIKISGHRFVSHSLALPEAGKPQLLWRSAGFITGVPGSIVTVSCSGSMDIQENESPFLTTSEESVLFHISSDFWIGIDWRYKLKEGSRLGCRTSSSSLRIKIPDYGTMIHLKMAHLREGYPTLLTLAPMAVHGVRPQLWTTWRDYELESQKGIDIIHPDDDFIEDESDDDPTEKFPELNIKRRRISDDGGPDASHRVWYEYADNDSEREWIYNWVNHQE